MLLFTHNSPLKLLGFMGSQSGHRPLWKPIKTRKYEKNKINQQ